MGIRSDCLYGQLGRTLWISYSDAGVKTEKSAGVAGKEGEYGDNVAELLVTERRSLDILPVNKEAKLSASEVPGEEMGSGEEDLQYRSLPTAKDWGCQRLKIQGWRGTLFPKTGGPWISGRPSFLHNTPLANCCISQWPS